jgi:type II secretory pathway pseudopilin PulG
MKQKGLTIIELTVSILAILLLAAVLMPALTRSQQTRVRLLCQTNLTALGRMMTIFANDNGGDYPRAGVAGTPWSSRGVLPNFYGGLRTYNRDQAFDIRRNQQDGTVTSPGEATVTSSWYLLVKYAGATPKSFICKADDDAEPFKLSSTHQYRRFAVKGIGLKDIYDFGDGHDGVLPGGHSSYAYHMPCADQGGISLAITDMFSPASPVAADRNPHLDKNAVEPELTSNSVSHGGTGQNVLYKDGRVKFQRTVTVGIAGDNIYTYGGGPEGTPPAANGHGVPAARADAYLVGEQNYRP